MNKEKSTGEVLKLKQVSRIIDTDYPYKPIEKLREGKFCTLDSVTRNNIRRLIMLKFLLYSPFKCMYIIKILKEEGKFMKTKAIIDELKQRKIINKNINQSDFKSKYLENLVYFGLLESNGKGKKRKYRVSAEFNTIKYEIPSPLLWIIKNEYSPIDYIWGIASKYNKKFGKVKCITQKGEKSEVFDIFKVIYSLMSCNASSEKTREILKKMDNEFFTQEMSKNQIVLDLIQSARDLGFNKIEEEMAKKSTEFLEIVLINNGKKQRLTNKLVKNIIENYLFKNNIAISKKISIELSNSILDYLITKAAKEKKSEVSKDDIIKGMDFMLFEKLQLDLENLNEESKKIFQQIRHKVEDPFLKKPPIPWLARKISYYFLIKKNFVISEEDALTELITNLSRNLPEQEATRYKKIKIAIIESIKQDIKNYLKDIDAFIDFLRFSKNYDEKRDQNSGLAFGKYRILEQLVLAIAQKENSKI